jgi:hypothetical protein
MSRLMTVLLVCSVTTVTALLCGCAKSSDQPRTSDTQSRNEPAATPSVSFPQLSPSTSPTPSQTPKQSMPPKPSEVREAVARVFEKVATPDTASSPGFVVGDFNGDGSEDLAVAVKPNEGALPEVNSEVANWILEDPKKVFVPGRDTAPRAPGKPVQAESDDTLLAIVHGIGPTGWRNREARQTFLLKNAVGTGMMTQPAKTLQAVNEKQKLPPFRGDTIRMTIERKSGVLFWTGAKYAWYSLGVE